MKNEYFFIVGCQRSGTTLLQEVLNLHPEISVLHETRFFRHVWGKRKWKRILGTSLWERLVLRPFFSTDNMSAHQLNVESILRTCRELEPGEMMECLRATMDEFAQFRGSRKCGEKSPIHLFFHSELARSFPGAPLLILLRDPRAVAASWKTWQGPQGVLRMAARWNLCWDHTRDLQASNGSNCVIRYEHLITNWKESIHQLGRLLDFSPVPSQINFQGGRAEFIQPWETHKANTTRRLQADRIEAWRKELTREEIAALYRSATVVAVPSRYEGFGLPAAEAMACGAPVVTTDGGALPEVTGDAAVIVPAGDASALASALTTVLGDTRLQERLGAKGARRAQALFSWEAHARGVSAVYERVIAARAAGTVPC